MYERDCPKIARHALASPNGFVDVVAFVLCTIRQPFGRVAVQMAEIREHGENAAALFGWKRAGYRYASEHRHVLHAAICEAVRVQDAVGAVDVLSAIPGLGMVKAAFVAQLCGLNVGCLDRHNLRRLGLPETALRFPKTLAPDTRRERIASYVRKTQRRGARGWWDSWCVMAAGTRGMKALDTADKVSAFHVLALGL